MTNEYLEYLTNKIRYKKEHIRDDLYRLHLKKNELELLEKELQRLESIDNAEPSEALKCLDLLGDFEWHKNPFKNAFPDLFKTIEQYILKAQEQEKENARYKRILSIIKEKNVSSRWLNYCDTVDLYNKCVLLDDKLTEEEFNLLKECFAE